MNASTFANPTEAQMIEAALDALVSAAVANLNEASLVPERGPVSLADMAHEFSASLEWTPAQRTANDLVQRPVSRALRQGIRALGERLFEIGGMALLHDVCDRVSASDPRHEARRAGIIDKRWDGIGRKNGQPGWCS